MCGLGIPQCDAHDEAYASRLLQRRSWPEERTTLSHATEASRSTILSRCTFADTLNSDAAWQRASGWPAGPHPAPRTFRPPGGGSGRGGQAVRPGEAEIGTPGHRRTAAAAAASAFAWLERPAASRSCPAVACRHKRDPFGAKFVALATSAFGGQQQVTLLQPACAAATHRRAVRQVPTAVPLPSAFPLQAAAAAADGGRTAVETAAADVHVRTEAGVGAGCGGRWGRGCWGRRRRTPARTLPGALPILAYAPPCPTLPEHS